MRLNLNGLVLVVGIVLFGVGGFALWSQSQGKSVGAGNPPHVTIVGDINKLPQYMKNDLPTGYSSLSAGAVIPVDSIATDDDDPVSIFLLKPGNPRYDIKEQMQYAIDRGKQEVYIIINEKKSFKEYALFTKEDLLETVQEINLFSIDDMFFDFLSVPSYANSVQGSNCGGSTLPAGTCSSKSFIDDDFGDGKTPSFMLCVDYAAFACYFNSLFDHLSKNLAETSTVTCNHTSSNSSQCPWVDCIKAHQYPGFIKAPVDLRYELFFNAQDLVNDPNACASNPNNLCGCAGIPNLESPRRSINGSVMLNGQNSCSWLKSMKHELAHTYGYNHKPGQQDYDNNLDQIRHCINDHQIH